MSVRDDDAAVQMIDDYYYFFIFTSATKLNGEIFRLHPSLLHCCHSRPPLSNAVLPAYNRKRVNSFKKNFFGKAMIFWRYHQPNEQKYTTEGALISDKSASM